MHIKNKIIIGTLIMMTFCTCVMAVTFTDLLEEHWAYQYVTTLSDNNIINGYPDGTYKPEGTISRAEFLKLVIAASMPKEVDISEVPPALEHWAGQYLFVAQTYGIVEAGSIDLTNIDEPITRMEMALIISKTDVMLRNKKINSNTNVTFNDYDTMNSEEIKWLTHAVGMNYINGYPDNTFKPDGNMTRAEAAAVIYRYQGIEVSQ